MFVLDTNILFAIMGFRPVPEVAAWIAGQPEDCCSPPRFARRKSCLGSPSCRKAAAV
jgi:hypothetical protein